MSEARTDENASPSESPQGRPEPRRRRWPFVVAAFIVAVAIFLVVGLTQGSVPLGAPRGFDLNQVRTLARRGDGALPVAIARHQVAKSEYPRVFVAAGWDWITRIGIVFAAFQIVYEDRYLVVDAPHEPATHEARFGGAGYSEEAYRELSGWLERAERVLVTHEHLDHVRGISQSPNFDELAPRVMLTRTQRDRMPDDTGFTAAQLSAIPAEEFAEPTRIAPGVVLIPAAGHTPGSIYLYVQLQNGHEYLFVGDAVWSHYNLNRARMRPLLLSWLLREDREAVANQVRSLADLRDDQPTLAVIPAHDDETVARYIAEGFVHEGFLEPPGRDAAEDQAPHAPATEAD